MNLNETTLANLKGTNPTPVNDIVNNHMYVGSLINEDLLDLSLSEMTEEEADAHALACNTYLTFKGSTISPQYLTIAEAGFDLFKDFLAEATGKRIGTERYITALSITFGAIGNYIRPIYQSVYLKWARHDAPTQKDLYAVSDSGYGEYYKFDGGAFVKISQTDRNTMVADYKKDIKIRHKNAENLEAFRPGVDAESILIPLQTIYTVMHNAHPSKLFITHAIREVQADRTSPMKHIVMVSGYKVPFVGLPVLYANRSHLCPPCAASFGFDLA